MPVEGREFGPATPNSLVPVSMTTNRAKAP